MSSTKKSTIFGADWVEASCLVVQALIDNKSANALIAMWFLYVLISAITAFTLKLRFLKFSRK